MITVKRSASLSSKGTGSGADRLRATGQQGAGGPATATLGTTSKSKGDSTLKKGSNARPSNAAGRGFVSESAGNNVSGMGPNVNVSSNPITLDLDPLLTGLTPQIENTYFHALYRDIYYQDPVAGSAVDLISTLPFSEFSLGGIADNKIASVFNETLERLNMRTLLPEISVDYLVLGSHTSSLLFNKESRRFTDIMPHAIENLTMECLPFYSQDPIITVKFSAQAKAILSKDTPRIKRIKERLGSSIVEKLQAGELELDPLSTLYIPRKTFSTTDLGTSYYRRILPIYLIEKNLFRGTLIESARRQRGIMHITLGDGDQWEPSIADMEFITDLFMNADSDPLGSIIATRMGVATEELRQGGDFWKVTDFSDSVLPHKLRALGISEGFLSGDANYSTADTSLTVFIETIRSFREMITRKIFYDKLFPLISMLNGYTLNAKGKVVIKEGLLEGLDPEDALAQMQDGSKLLIPTVTWAKQLKPEGDTAYLEMLSTMSEKGIPVPLRVMAAAGGLNLDELLRQQDDDLTLRKRVAEYKKNLDALNPKPEEEGGGGDEEDVAEASAAILALSSEDPTGSIRSAVQARGGKISLLNRDFQGQGEITAKSKTGRTRMVHNQHRANEKINLSIVRAMKEAQTKGMYSSSTTARKA